MVDGSYFLGTGRLYMRLLGEDIENQVLLATASPPEYPWELSSMAGGFFPTQKRKSMYSLSLSAQAQLTVRGVLIHIGRASWVGVRLRITDAAVGVIYCLNWVGMLTVVWCMYVYTPETPYMGGIRPSQQPRAPNTPDMHPSPYFTVESRVCLVPNYRLY